MFFDNIDDKLAEELVGKTHVLECVAKASNPEPGEFDKKSKRRR